MSTTSLLSDSAGKTLVGVRRVLFVHHGAVKDGTGPLELTFDGGTSVLLEAGGDGESLSVVAGIWLDAFEEPLTDENRRFVEKSGKWKAFDMTTHAPYSRAVGHQLRQVDYVRSPPDKVVGVTLQLDDVVIRASVDADELIVDVA